MTKSAYEFGRTFATLFMDMDFRHSLVHSRDRYEFLEFLAKRAEDLSLERSKRLAEKPDAKKVKEEAFCQFGSGLFENIKRRIKYYPSDFTDGLVGHKTIHKTLSTTLFLYFACILPCIAFGVLNSKNTNKLIGIN